VEEIQVWFRHLLFLFLLFFFLFLSRPCLVLSLRMRRNQRRTLSWPPLWARVGSPHLFAAGGRSHSVVQNQLPVWLGYIAFVDQKIAAMKAKPAKDTITQEVFMAERISSPPEIHSMAHYPNLVCWPFSIHFLFMFWALAHSLPPLADSILPWWNLMMMRSGNSSLMMMATERRRRRRRRRTLMRSLTRIPALRTRKFLPLPSSRIWWRWIRMSLPRLCWFPTGSSELRPLSRPASRTNPLPLRPPRCSRDKTLLQSSWEVLERPRERRFITIHHPCLPQPVPPLNPHHPGTLLWGLSCTPTTSPRATSQPPFRLHPQRSREIRAPLPRRQLHSPPSHRLRPPPPSPHPCHPNQKFQANLRQYPLSLSLFPQSRL